MVEVSAATTVNVWRWNLRRCSQSAHLRDSYGSERTSDLGRRIRRRGL